MNAPLADLAVGFLTWAVPVALLLVPHLFGRSAAEPDVNAETAEP